MFSIVKLIDGIKKRVPVLPLVKGNGTNVVYREEGGYLEATSDLETQNLVVLESLRTAHADVDSDITVHGNLYVSGKTVTTEEVSLETDSPYVVLRKNNPSGLGLTEKAGLIVHNYQTSKDAFIGVDSNGTFRVSDNTVETKKDYTTLAYFDGLWYTYLSNEYNPLPVPPEGDVVVQEEIYEYEKSFKIGNIFYHVSEGKAYKIKGSALDVEPSEVEIPSELGKYVYFPIISFLVISDVENEPLLTRAEETDMKPSVLLWDAVNKKAISTSVPTVNGQVLSAKIDETGTSYEWSNSSGGGGTYIFETMADFNAAKALIPGQEGYIPSNSTVIIKEATTAIISEDR